MQKLFELKIFRTDTPYKLSFEDEFRKSITITGKYYEDIGLIPGRFEYFNRCIYNHLYDHVKDEDDDLVTEITYVLMQLDKTDLIDLGDKEQEVKEIV